MPESTITTDTTNGRATPRCAFVGERILLRRQVARKFEAATAYQLASAIADMDDPERLAEVGEAIIDCNTAGYLVDRIRAICRQDAERR